jgi:hypothetical protein
MSTFPDGSQQSFTAQEIDAWLLTAQEKLAFLHLHAVEPGRPFAALSQICM